MCSCEICSCSCDGICESCKKNVKKCCSGCKHKACDDCDCNLDLYENPCYIKEISNPEVKSIFREFAFKG